MKKLPVGVDGFEKISIGSDKALFDGLKISQKTELCEEYMG